ncbi:MAG: FG-GAP repeat domain-containing protein, partial [Candidatus Zixiibacteriota bacterium]
MRYLIPAGFLALLSAGASAQYVKQYNPWPVISGTDTLDLPFWGGINSPKSDLVDFDGDGLFDLFIASAQEGAERVSYLKNTGTAEKPAWTPVTERFGEINTGKWFRFADIDADGDLDLFCDSRTGFASFYRNESVGADLRFVLVKEVYGGFQTGFNNTPEFADIDGDGDLDFFFGNLAGGLDLYRNIGTPTTAVFILETSA